MKKRNRHELIKEMVRKNRLATQKDIQSGLEAQGIEVTQTTLSRDLRELGLIKARDKGESFYVLPEHTEPEEFSELLAPYIRKIERASFVLVLHTRLGDAGLASNIIDKANPYQILGTVAGADTLLVICRDESCAIEVEEALLAHQDSLGFGE